MNNIDCPNMLKAIKRDFGGLWHCVKRGKTLEIVTPYLYPDSTFVSVFITERGEKIIVSDGAQLSEFIASTAGDESLQSASLFRFSESHEIKEHLKLGVKYYFKSCSSIKLVSSIVFDMCNFISCVASASVLTIAAEDQEDREIFRRKADAFINKSIGTKKVKFSHSLPEIKEATFSAVIKSNSQLWLVLYLTGSNLNYFSRSASNAIVNVEFARASSLESQIKAIIPVVNNEADGYQPAKLSQRIEMLSRVAKQSPINWTEKEQLERLIAASHARGDERVGRAVKLNLRNEIIDEL